MAEFGIQDCSRQQTADELQREVSEVAKEY